MMIQTLRTASATLLLLALPACVGENELPRELELVKQPDNIVPFG